MPKQKPQVPGETRRIPAQARARATVDAILFAAAHILKRDGIELASTARIARAAGVSIGSLYQYFPDKAAILAALKERHREWYEAAIRGECQRGSSRSFRGSAHKAVERFVGMHAVDPAMHNALCQGEDLQHGETDVRARDVLAAFLADHMSDRIPDPELAAYIAIRAMEAVIHGTALEAPDRLSHPLFVDELTELFVGYLDR